MHPATAGHLFAWHGRTQTILEAAVLAARSRADLRRPSGQHGTHSSLVHSIGMFASEALLGGVRGLSMVHRSCERPSSSLLPAQATANTKRDQVMRLGNIDNSLCECCCNFPVLHTLRAVCSVFRNSVCAAARDDVLRPRQKCFCMCNLVGANKKLH